MLALTITFIIRQVLIISKLDHLPFMCAVGVMDPDPISDLYAHN